ncbi:hypothetical protein [Acinetobacter sp. YH01009]|uniref:hypothetical protein n=1 Tax=Acinetobacter TaxID=469 RepID=UPI0015D3FDAD|nr:hypothetical protein [Acinetobacter sp. YH01009]
MLGSSLGLSATLDQAIDRASMSLDYLRLNNNKAYNEEVLLNHIAKLEKMLVDRNNQYNQLVNQANTEINAVADKHNLVIKELNETKIELEKEKLNSFDMANKVKTLNNVNRAYIHGIKQLDGSKQRLVFEAVKQYIEVGSSKNSLLKIKF